MRYWALATRGMDFSVEDRVDAVAYNKVLWLGLMSGRAYLVRVGERAAPRRAAPRRRGDDDDVKVSQAKGALRG